MNDGTPVAYSAGGRSDGEQQASRKHSRDVTVEGVNGDGDTATAEFSNGKQVAFARGPDGAWKVAETPRVC